MNEGAEPTNAEAAVLQELSWTSLHVPAHAPGLRPPPCWGTRAQGVMDGGMEGWKMDGRWSDGRWMEDGAMEDGEMEG